LENTRKTPYFLPFFTFLLQKIFFLENEKTFLRYGKRLSFLSFVLLLLAFRGFFRNRDRGKCYAPQGRRCAYRKTQAFLQKTERLFVHIGKLG
jgi:hypothetical protein